jgi:hypothetical protein
VNQHEHNKYFYSQYKRSNKYYEHSIYHKHHNSMHRHHINAIHHNFMWKSNAGENHRMLFLFIKEYIHWKHQLPISPYTTRMRLQPPIYNMQPEGSSNFLIYWLQLEGGSTISNTFVVSFDFNISSRLQQHIPHTKIHKRVLQIK